jgi:hypothetical protein
MESPNENAHRANGGQDDALAGLRQADASTDLPGILAQAEPWTGHLHGMELGVLFTLMRRQGVDAAPVAVKYAELAEALHIHFGYAKAAVWKLRALGLVDVALQGSASAANQYRVPNPLPNPPQPLAAPPRKPRPARDPAQLARSERRSARRKREDSKREFDAAAELRLFVERFVDGTRSKVATYRLAQAAGLSHGQVQSIVKRAIRQGAIIVHKVKGAKPRGRRPHILHRGELP